MTEEEKMRFMNAKIEEFANVLEGNDLLTSLNILSSGFINILFDLVMQFKVHKDPRFEYDQRDELRYHIGQMVDQVIERSFKLKGMEMESESFWTGAKEESLNDS